MGINLNASIWLRKTFFEVESNEQLRFPRSPLMNLKGTVDPFEEGTCGDITAGGTTRLASAQKNLDRLIAMINRQ